MQSNIASKAGPMDEKSLGDTVKMNEWKQVAMDEYDAFHLRRKEILKDLETVVYPDISFKDADGKSWSLSDFSDKKIILNFNYSFCTSCMNFIDTLVSSCNSQCKLIVLLPDNPQYSGEVLEKYGSKALIGFTSVQFNSHYSLNSDNPSVFLLSKGRFIYYLYDTYHLKNSRKVFQEQVNSWP
jgi:hypothetical protein